MLTERNHDGVGTLPASPIAMRLILRRAFRRMLVISNRSARSWASVTCLNAPP